MGVVLAAGITAAATGASAYRGRQESKKGRKFASDSSKKALSELKRINLGDVPDAAMYDPVDFDRAQIEAIMANRDALPDIQQVMAGANTAISNDAIRRAIKLIPGYMQSMRTMGSNTNELINGRLPFEDVMDIVGDRGAMTGALGIPGTGGAATLKDLGISRMDAMKTGSGMLGDMIGMAETISPRGSYVTPQSMMVSPMDRIRNEMEQNGLVQQSNQNFNNLAAQADPNDLAIAQLLTGQSLLGNVGGGGRGIDAGALTGAAGDLVGGVNAWGKREGHWGTPAQTGGGGYYSEKGMWKAAPYAYGSSYTDGIGYVPTAKVIGSPAGTGTSGK